MRDIPADFPKILDTDSPSFGRFVPGTRHRNARHVQEKARVDTVIAGLDAFAAEYAGAGPFSRQIGSFASSDDVENARDRRPGIAARDACGLLDGTGLEALAAGRAGVDHRVNAGSQGHCEGAGHGPSREVL